MPSIFVALTGFVYRAYTSNAYAVFGYMLLFGITLMNFFAFSKGVEYKNGPVIETLAFILVMILSRLFFQEKITKRKAVGNLLILLGVIIFYMHG